MLKKRQKKKQKGSGKKQKGEEERKKWSKKQYNEKTISRPAKASVLIVIVYHLKS